MIAPRDGVPARWRIELAVCSIIALIAMLTLRLLGPSDLYDQTQPKTISYTTDIIVSGGTHWILPIERGELPATKPPLYNWLAVPGVKWLGFNSEIAHKLPSIAAMLACWLIITRLARSHALSGEASPLAGSLRDPGRSESPSTSSLGALAGLFFVSNYAIFKLGYLARPDMLLTLWLLIAWVCATRCFTEGVSATVCPEGQTVRGQAIESESLDARTACRERTSHGTRCRFAILFWLAVTLAALTKGPAALVVVIFAIVAARVVASRFSAIRLLHPIIGSLFAITVFGAWVFTVWRINPTHLHDQLWINEIYGRVTGTGIEGTHRGTREFLRELPYQSFYFLTRFAPWSLLTVIAIAVAFAPREWIARVSHPFIRRWMNRLSNAGEQCAIERAWMRSASIFVLLTVALFSLSVGKRADYVAVAIPQASLLAAWALLRVWPHVGVRLPWLAPLAAAITLAALSQYDRMQKWAPQPGFGDEIRAFIDASTNAIASQPGEVLNCSAGQTYVQAALGISEGDQRRAVADAIATREPFWVVAGRTQNEPHEFNLWLTQRRFAAHAEAIVRSAELPRAAGWPAQVTLWRVTPN